MSLEFLIGRSLGNHILNMDIEHETKEAMHKYALDLEEVASEEKDAGLGVVERQEADEDGIDDHCKGAQRRDGDDSEDGVALGVGGLRHD